MNDCILGLDSGGSKTLMVVADRHGQVLKTHVAAGLDPMANPHWQQQLTTLLQAAQGFNLAAAVLGLPLHGEVPQCSSAQRELARAALNCPVTVENDVRVAFDGAFTGTSAGVLILAGTGSMAWASRHEPDALPVRVGGWGDLFGDEGSAYWIGMQALIIACRSIDGRASEPRLTQALLKHLHLAPEQLAAWLYECPDRRAQVAALAQQVSAWATAGDSAAAGVLAAAADHLAEHVSTAWAALGVPGAPAWSHAGGVFANPLMSQHLAQRLGSAPLAPHLPPVGGALWRAAQNAGWNPDNTWVQRLSSTLTSTLALPSTSPLPM